MKSVNTSIELRKSCNTVTQIAHKSPKQQWDASRQIKSKNSQLRKVRAFGGNAVRISIDLHDYDPQATFGLAVLEEQAPRVHSVLVGKFDDEKPLAMLVTEAEASRCALWMDMLQRSRRKSFVF